MEPLTQTQPAPALMGQRRFRAMNTDVVLLSGCWDDDAPGSRGWPVAVADPLADDDLTVICLRDEALATSTTVRRRWRRDGRWLHHIIDPRTGEPADTDVIPVSVVAPTAVQADVLAKAALLMGHQRGMTFLSELKLAGLFVLPDGSWETNELWNRKENQTCIDAWR